MKPARRVHLEIQKHRSSFYGVLRSSYREDGLVKHSNHGRITGLALDQLQLIQAAFRGEVVPKDSPDAFQILSTAIPQVDVKFDVKKGWRPAFALPHGGDEK